ncbi:MAG: AAA family ATPase [Isosphaeraceae bacterium]
MKHTIRVTLIDPKLSSRSVLQAELEGMSEVNPLEVSSSYEASFTQVVGSPPDVVLIAIESDLEQALQLVNRLSQAVRKVPLIAIGPDNDATVILRSIRAGAREFLPWPGPSHELREILARLCQAKDPKVSVGPVGPRVIALSGASGGVGCSSVAVNLASTLVKLSKRDTVLTDFDLLLGSVEESLAVIADNSLEVLVRNMDELNSDLIKRWLPRHACGLYVLPHPVKMEDAARLNPEDLSKVLKLLKNSFSSVVVDTSKGFQSTDFIAYDAADLILLVIQLNLSCIRNTVRMLQYLRAVEGLGEKIRLVVNRLNSSLCEISLKKAEDLLKMPISWQIPNSSKLFRLSRNQGLPIAQVEGGLGCKVDDAFLTMARDLQPYPAIDAKTRPRIFSALRRKSPIQVEKRP